MIIHLWELPDDLRVTFNPEACRRLRHKLSENGWYRKSTDPWTSEARIYHQLGMDWSNRGRRAYNKLGHPLSLSLRDCKELSRKAKVSLEDLEKEVTSLFRNSSTRGNVGPFPIQIDENYAWLAGLWFGCGAFYAREREVRFRVEYEVADEVKRRAGNLGCNFKASRYMQHKARFPRVMVILPRTMYAIFKKLGFPNEVKGYPSSLKLGRNPAAREVHLMVPEFVKGSPPLGRAFVEGYMNSTKLCITRKNKRVLCFGKMVKARISSVDIRFNAPTKRQILKFAHFVTGVLQMAGFPGSWHEIPKRTGENRLFGYTITRKTSIKALFRDFHIVKGSAQRVLRGI